MLKRVNYAMDGEMILLVDADDDGEAIHKAQQALAEFIDYYEEEELEEVKNLDNYEVIDISSDDCLCELGNVIRIAVENSMDVSVVDDAIILQRY